MANAVPSSTLARALAGIAAGFALAAATLVSQLAAPAAAQEPIKIGFGMALTGPLAPNGKSALLGMRIWEEDINAKGGLLGRKVQLVYLDDQSTPSNVPRIYTKLLDVDKVDLIVSGYAVEHDRAGDADRHPTGQGVSRPVRHRHQRPVQLRQVFRHDPDRPRSQAGLHQAVVRRGHGAERPSRRPSRSPRRMRNSGATSARARARTPRRRA